MYASYTSPSLQRKKTTSNKTKTKSSSSTLLTPKKKPEWSPYLTEDNKFALSKDEILRRKLTLISKHNMFNGELAVVDSTRSKDMSKKQTKTTNNKTMKTGPMNALDLISMSKIEASLEENEHLELDDDYENDDDDDEIMSRLDDNEETLLMEVSPEGAVPGMAREAFRQLSPGECPRTVSKFSSSVSNQSHRQHHPTVMNSDEDDEDSSYSEEEEEEDEADDDLESEDADVVAGLRLAKSIYSTKHNTKSMTSAACRVGTEDEDIEYDKENIPPPVKQRLGNHQVKKNRGTGLELGLGDGDKQEFVYGPNHSRNTTRMYRTKGTSSSTHPHRPHSRPVTVAGHGRSVMSKGKRGEHYSSTTTPTPTRTPRSILTTPTKTISAATGTTTTGGVSGGGISGGTTTHHNKYRKTLFPSSPPPQRLHTNVVPSFSLAHGPSPRLVADGLTSRPSPNPRSIAEVALVAEHDLQEISQQIVSLHAELR